MLDEALSGGVIRPGEARPEAGGPAREVNSPGQRQGGLKQGSDSGVKKDQARERR